MKKLHWMDINEIFTIENEEDLNRINKAFDDEIELTYDEDLKVYDEAGNYIADLKERK